MYGNYLFFETPDCYLVSLDAATGKERWHKEIADVRQQYFCTPAPIIIGNHVIVGIGGDSLDVQGFLESRDPKPASVQWRWYTTPQKMGDAGSDTWPDEYSMTHGGGMTWLPPTYDPELNLLYVPTGNPNPVFAPQQPQGRQPLHLRARRAESGHRKHDVVFPDLAARHARLGQRAGAGAHRRPDRRPAEKAGRAGGAQRLLLPDRSHERQERPDRARTSTS